MFIETSKCNAQADHADGLTSIFDDALMMAALEMPNVFTSEEQPNQGWQLEASDGLERASKIDTIAASKSTNAVDKIISIQDIFQNYQPSIERRRANYQHESGYLQAMANAVQALSKSAVAKGINLWASLKNAPQKVVDWLASASTILASKMLGTTAEAPNMVKLDSPDLIAQFNPQTNQIDVNTNNIETVADLVTAIYHETMHKEQNDRIKAGLQDGDTAMMREASRFYWLSGLGSELYPKDPKTAAQLNKYFYRANPLEAEAFVAYNRMRRALHVPEIL